MRPHLTAEDALRDAYFTVAKADIIGLNGAGTEFTTGGKSITAHEHLANAVMIINVAKDTLRDPYRAAVHGSMMIVNWNAPSAWHQRREKYDQMLRLATWVDCPNSRYKLHALCAWAGLHPLDDERWARDLGRTERTLRRWRNGKNGVTVMADLFLRMGLSMLDDQFETMDIVRAA